MTVVTQRPSGLLTHDLVEEAARQFNICNACRYCEGLCAVFPALERRLTFREADVAFLANLCHDCRSCFDACPYATPHVFAVDIPPLMSEIREQTYEGLMVPRAFARLTRARLTLLLAVVAVVAVVAAAWIGTGSGFFAIYDDAGSFYEIVPFLAMVVPALAITGFAVVAMYIGGRRFMRLIDQSAIKRPHQNLGRTVLDVALFRNMDGGGPGCNYPGEALSQSRRIAHSLMFYGFGAAFASTTVAAIYQDFFHILPPYPVLSLPVVLGMVGGVLMIAASVIMFAQKRESRVALETSGMKSMDMSFISLLFAVNLTGLVLLALRVTNLMGLLLTVHLGLVAALFITLPYGKFVHGIYRTLALYRNAGEEERAPLSGH